MKTHLQYFSAMHQIPITFDHEGKQYSGYFSKVAGAGQTGVWYLSDNNNLYLGRLRYTDRWVFDPTPKTESLAALADFFGDFITAWYE